MKENSIEEDIKNAEHFIKSIKTDKEYKEDGWHGYYNKEIVELARILQHILSDYKRVLKENEELNLKYSMLYAGKIENMKAQEVKIKSQVIPVQKVKDILEQKDKIIELMADDIRGTQVECNRYFKDKEDVKQYFKNKAKELLNK